MAVHALVTGPINGRIPIDHPDHPENFVDVTPDVLYFEGPDPADPPGVVSAVADAIEAEHYARGSHPVQLACKAIDDPGQYGGQVPHEVRKAHQAEHKALDKKMGRG